MADTAGGFWVRHSIDGTEAQVFGRVKKVLQTFESTALGNPDHETMVGAGMARFSAPDAVTRIPASRGVSVSTHTRQTFYGNVGATTDTYFLINGNVKSQIALIGRDNETNLTLSEVEAAGRFPRATVLGEFTDEQTSGGLRRFVVSRIAAHTAIAERAFELFQAGSGGTAERNWLDAERQLLGL